MSKLLNIFELSETKGRPVRQLRTFVEHRVIPYLKIGHRTILFDPEKVEKALQRFEVKEVCASRSLIRGQTAQKKSGICCAATHPPHKQTTKKQKGELS